MSPLSYFWYLANVMMMNVGLEKNMFTAFLCLVEKVDVVLVFCGQNIHNKCIITMSSRPNIWQRGSAERPAGPALQTGTIGTGGVVHGRLRRTERKQCGCVCVF